jgi:hypothetical protein
MKNLNLLYLKQHMARKRYYINDLKQLIVLFKYTTPTKMDKISNFAIK